MYVSPCWLANAGASLKKSRLWARFYFTNRSSSCNLDISVIGGRWAYSYCFVRRCLYEIPRRNFISYRKRRSRCAFTNSKVIILGEIIALFSALYRLVKYRLSLDPSWIHLIHTHTHKYIYIYIYIYIRWGIFKNKFSVFVKCFMLWAVQQMIVKQHKNDWIQPPENTAVENLKKTPACNERFQKYCLFI